MLGHAREIEKGMLFSQDWHGPFYRAAKVKKGKVSMLITLDGGDRMTLPVDSAVRFVKPGVDPQPICLTSEYKKPTRRKKGETTNG